MATPTKRAAMLIATLTLTLSACAETGARKDRPAASPSQEKPAATTIRVGTAEESEGPAPPEPGAVRGGTVHVLDRDDFPHLDPARIYINYGTTVSKLFTRTLTGYKIGRDGSITLVGDLAVDTGRTNDGGKTWTFVLKPGLKWQDGSPITAADIKHTFERTFAPFTAEGPSYAERWLLPKGKRYDGPYGGRHLDTIQVLDDRTIRFHLNQPRPDFNFTVAMTGYGAVPRAHDTRERYDRRPFSSGPYKIKSRVPGTSMELVRNPHWDPATDPIRNAYPDRWRMEFGVQAEQSTDRFIAESGTDRQAMSFHNPVVPERLQEVTGDPELMRRVVRGPTPYTTFYTINTSRVRDVRVRQAIIKAFPMRQTRQLLGGALGAGQYASTVLNPTVLGYESFDLYGQLTRPEGDPEAAKKLLAEAGQPNPTIVYAYNQVPSQEKTMLAIKAGLEKAGFTVVAKPLNPATYYDAIGKVDNPYDLYWQGWAADWPTGYSTLAPLFGSDQVVDHGTNTSHLSDPEVDRAIERATRITDTAEAGRAWAAIDRMVMERAVVVPELYRHYFGLHGSGLGGVRLDPLTGEQSPTNVYVKR